MAYCGGLCVLSISWALVLYSRACCLIRPGHLAMPPAALLCQLVWRAGMLGARVTCLMFFARVFNWWVCGVAGEWRKTFNPEITPVHLAKLPQKVL